MPRPSRALAVGGHSFDAEAWKKRVLDAVTTGVRISAEKAMRSAIEDAPVREVFRKTGKKGGGLRRGLRTRPLSLQEAFSEEAQRRVLGLAPALPGVTRTRGRRVVSNPYLRRAATRRGNPNSFQPFVLRPATTRKDVEEQRKIFEETQARGFGVGQKFEMEIEPEVRGGREVTSGGRLRSRKAKGALTSRGRYELKSGRSIFKGTLGGRLRGEIHMRGPFVTGNHIKASVVSPTYYAKFQEFGTRHNRATPYLRPAILKLTTSYRREIVKAINAMGGRRR